MKVMLKPPQVKQRQNRRESERKKIDQKRKVQKFTNVKMDRPCSIKLNQKLKIMKSKMKLLLNKLRKPLLIIKKAIMMKKRKE